VVVTDHVWESLEMEKKTLEGTANLVVLQTKKPEAFLPECAWCCGGAANQVRSVADSYGF
jgi:hypothetical protein